MDWYDIGYAEGYDGVDYDPPYQAYQADQYDLGYHHGNDDYKLDLLDGSING